MDYDVEKKEWTHLLGQEEVEIICLSDE